jgi:DUF4097 and DUF4098 domain-containing protein YvlB
MSLKRNIWSVLLTMTMLVAAASGVMAQTRDEMREEFHKTYPLAANGRVALENINGSVKIASWDRNEVKVDAVKSAYKQERLNEAQIIVEADADSVNVRTDYPSGNQTFTSSFPRRYDNPATVEYTLTVPRRVRIDTIELINGDLDIEGVEGDVVASSINGHVRAMGLGGEAKLSTINGVLEATFKKLDDLKGISLNSVNGRVLLVIPSDANAQLRASTVHGAITNDFNIPVRDGEYVGHDLAGTLGRGGVRIKLGNVNGAVSIRHASDGRTLSPVTEVLVEKEKNKYSYSYKYKIKGQDSDDSDAAEAAREAQREAREAQREAREAQREALREAARARAQAQRDTEQARRDVEQGRREAEQAGREAQQAGRVAEQAGRTSQLEAEQARREAEQARLESQRDAAQARAEAAREKGQEQAAAQRELAQANAEIQRAAARAARDATREIELHRRDIERAARVQVRDELRINGVTDTRLIERESKSFTVSGTPQINVETFDGTINVTAWDKPEVSVTAVKRASGDQSLRGIQLKTVQNGNVITLRAEFDKTYARRVENVTFYNASVNYEINVPRNASIKAISADGRLVVEGVSGNLDLRTSDGAVDVRGGQGHLIANTSDGRVRISDFDGTVDARTGDGSMILEGRFTQLSARTGDGSITLAVPSTSSAMIETSADSISNDGLNLTEETGDSKRLRRWRMGGGGSNTYTLRTGDGHITLRPLDK